MDKAKTGSVVDVYRAELRQACDEVYAMGREHAFEMVAAHCFEGVSVNATMIKKIVQRRDADAWTRIEARAKERGQSLRLSWYRRNETFLHSVVFVAIAIGLMALIDTNGPWLWFTVGFSLCSVSVIIQLRWGHAAKKWIQQRYDRKKHRRGEEVGQADQAGGGDRHEQSTGVGQEGGQAQERAAEEEVRRG